MNNEGTIIFSVLVVIAIMSIILAVDLVSNHAVTDIDIWLASGVAIGITGLLVAGVIISTMQTKLLERNKKEWV